MPPGNDRISPGNVPDMRPITSVPRSLNLNRTRTTPTNSGPGPLRLTASAGAINPRKLEMPSDMSGYVPGMTSVDIGLPESVNISPKAPSPDGSYAMETGDGEGAQQQATLNVVVNTAQVKIDPNKIKDPNAQRPWISRFFSCFDNVAVCACSFFCPFIYLCTTYHMVEEDFLGLWMPLCNPWLTLTYLRIYVRGEESIDGEICMDCCLSNCCFCCVLSQIRQEWDYVIRQEGHRIGYDPSDNPQREEIPEEYRHVPKQGFRATDVDVAGFDTAPFDRTKHLVEYNPYGAPIDPATVDRAGYVPPGSQI